MWFKEPSRDCTGIGGSESWNRPLRHVEGAMLQRAKTRGVVGVLVVNRR